MADTKEQFEKVIAQCRELFEKKLKDYGPSWRIMRPQSVTDQIFIKANRIRSLEIKGFSMVSEGIRPEFVGIVNYGIIGLIQLNKGFADTTDISAEEALALYDKYMQETKELMYENELDPQVYPYLHGCARENGFIILSYKDEYIVSEDAGDPYVQHEAFLNKMPSITVQNFLDVINFPVPKCLIVGNPEPLAVLEQKMKRDLEGRMNVFRSEPFFLELVPNGIDKARSLAVLLEKLGMGREEMVAVGDGFNDLSMIQFAGLGVAMANAQEVVKQHADFITLSNEEDGVAAVVDRFFLDSF